MDTSNTRRHRKPYHKPVVQEVRLRIGEAVLATQCRVVGASGTYINSFASECTGGSIECLQADGLG